MCGVRMTGEAKGMEEEEGGGGDAKALESWGENLGMGMIQSRQGQPQPALRYGSRMPSELEYGILMERRGGDPHVQQLSIDQRLKNCTLKSLLTSKS